MGLQSFVVGQFAKPREDVRLARALIARELTERFEANLREKAKENPLFEALWFGTPEAHAKEPYEEANQGMSLTEAVEQIRRKPRSERLSGELNTPELRKRDGRS